MQERNIISKTISWIFRELSINHINITRAMFIQWNGKRRLYAGNDGMCVIIKNKDRWVYRTARSKNNFDDNSRKILEVLDNVGL